MCHTRLPTHRQQWVGRPSRIQDALPVKARALQPGAEQGGTGQCGAGQGGDPRVQVRPAELHLQRREVFVLGTVLSDSSTEPQHWAGAAWPQRAYAAGRAARREGQGEEKRQACAGAWVPKKQGETSSAKDNLKHFCSKQIPLTWLSMLTSLVMMGGGP